jgi:SpoVK/Ycf46/Vps4 family AAA+-type ATPase
MKLVITHDREDAIIDILVYLFEKTNSTNGIFVDIHPKTYKMGILQNMDENVTYKNIEFSLCKKGDYLASSGRITRYFELALIGDESEIQQFCKEAFIHAKKRLNNSIIKGKLNIFSFDGCWDYLDCSEIRPLESLNLSKSQVSDIIDDVNQFVSEQTREKYKNLAIPHSRMYMLYGPPGTGKTSLIKAIANAINYNVGIIEFDKDMDDKSLKHAITKRPENTILIFEDIDCLFESRKKSDEFSTKVTFSGLLNTFDGIVTNENLIVIFTTNHLEILDQALKRRIDYFLKFDYATKVQIKHMYSRFFPTQESHFEDFFENIKHVKITPNILQKFFTKHLYHNIYEYSHELTTFATGEIAVESLNQFYT